MTFAHHIARNVALQWEQDQLGTLQITIEGIESELSQPSDGDRNVWAEIPFTDRPEEIRVQISYDLEEGVELFHIEEQKPMKIRGKVPELIVPVHWRKSATSGWVPSTRAKHKDNIDLVLYNALGGFVMVEVGITSRNGKIYLILQEVYAGQVCHTNVARAKKAGYTYHPLDQKNGLVGMVLPLWDHNAYPGADFLRTWGKEGPRLVEIIWREGKSLPYSKVEAAEWDPPKGLGLQKDGTVVGVCTFFNIAATYGFVWVPPHGDEPAKSYFAHFSEIQGGLLSLQPMKPYRFTPHTGDDGKLKATKIHRHRR